MNYEIQPIVRLFFRMYNRMLDTRAAILFYQALSNFLFACSVIGCYNLLTGDHDSEKIFLYYKWIIYLYYRFLFFVFRSL